MKCRKCGGGTKIVDTRCTDLIDNYLTRRADLVTGDVPIRVRRRECKSCKKKFDTFEIAFSDLRKIKENDCKKS